MHVPCPCFYPQQTLPWIAWPGRFPIPPLGRPCAGVCKADPQRDYEPTGELLMLGCNMGYARRRCKRVPKSAPDAARFSLNSAGQVRWSLERDHRPVSQGVVEPGRKTGAGEIVDAQAEVYFDACVERLELIGNSSSR